MSQTRTPVSPEQISKALARLERLDGKLLCIRGLLRSHDLDTMAADDMRDLIFEIARIAKDPAIAR